MILSIAFVLILLYFIRKRYLKEQYSLLWLLFGISMIILSFSSKWLDTVADFFNVKYAPSLLFLLGILFCLFLILHLTVIVSKLSDRVVRLTQEIGIMRNELENQEKD